MKKLFAIVSLALLTGCDPQGTYAYYYSVGCLSIESEVTLNRSEILWGVELASKAADDHYGQTGEFCEIMRTTPIHVLRDPWPCSQHPEGNGCSGMHTPDGIYLESSGKSLLHEYFHRWDTIHGNIGTMWHENWDKNGNTELGETYKKLSVPYHAWQENYPSQYDYNLDQ